jgi:hypothetical protein
VNRRIFLNRLALITAALYLPAPHAPRTKHLIFIVTGGARKKDYYEDVSLAPNVRRLAGEGFVFEEDHCEQIASHNAAFAELLGGATYPTVHSLDLIPSVMERRRPQVLVCREMAHDTGHVSSEAYLQAVKTTDDGVGNVIDWVKSHPNFCRNTAIVIRPEFGRDDEVNADGALHHSYGFYSTHRVARVLWGPDVKTGVDKKTVVSSRDMAPMIRAMLGWERGTSDFYDLGFSAGGGGASTRSSDFTLNLSKTSLETTFTAGPSDVLT